ncbi:MAG: hypothetical protein CL535_14885 [Ahrensia sp.]|nr:hypothetical protein [Ahrensia sp.]
MTAIAAILNKKRILSLLVTPDSADRGEAIRRTSRHDVDFRTVLDQKAATMSTTTSKTTKTM